MVKNVYSYIRGFVFDFPHNLDITRITITNFFLKKSCHGGPRILILISLWPRKSEKEKNLPSKTFTHSIWKSGEHQSFIQPCPIPIFNHTITPPHSKKTPSTLIMSKPKRNNNKLKLKIIHLPHLISLSHSLSSNS